MSENNSKVKTKFMLDIEKYDKYYDEQIRKIQEEHIRKLSLPIGEEESFFDQEIMKKLEKEEILYNESAYNDEVFDNEMDCFETGYSAIVTIPEPIEHEIIRNFKDICSSFKKEEYLDNKIDDIDLSLCRYSLINLQEIKLLIDDIIHKNNPIKKLQKINTTTIYLSKIDDMVSDGTFKYTDGDYELLKNIYADVDSKLWSIYRPQDLNKKINVKRVLTLEEQMYFLSNFPIFVNSSYMYTLFYIDSIFVHRCIARMARNTTYLQKILIDVKYNKNKEEVHNEILLRMLPTIDSYISIVQNCLNINTKKRVRK